MFWSFACFFRDSVELILVRPTLLQYEALCHSSEGTAMGMHTAAVHDGVSAGLPVTVSLADVLICLPLPISYPAVHTH